ncbi:class I SAM-dependent methyltransferase [Halobacillus sp. A5]|uniref:tRNA (mnm(5)s(2)U34)-methyltransferase n=1 Tax=Halobacillus sp. A5 TaxID=2880263 RepID=UPI0020A6A243|nr:class I SAM-dependent methyltransferase [Halobacillus sp. A5]MCP3028314.1 methyltransferase domain-containing protein [Halobacillus sp. A5]
MKLKRILHYAHDLIEQTLKEGDVAVDGTCGNGHDTVHLCRLVGSSGHVYGYDIQHQAIENTLERLNTHNLSDRATILQISHDEIKATIPEDDLARLKAAIFNLGYLPGSDKQVVTTPEVTIRSVKTLLYHLNKGGIIVVVVYHGHPGGGDEKDALLQYVQSLDQKTYSVLQYGFINQKNTPPFIIAIEKKQLGMQRL